MTIFCVILTLIFLIYVLYLYNSKLPAYRIVERTNKLNERKWVIQGKIILGFYGLCSSSGNPLDSVFTNYDCLKEAETKLYEFEKKIRKNTWKNKVLNKEEYDYAEFLKWKEETDMRHEKVIKE